MQNIFYKFYSFYTLIYTFFTFLLIFICLIFFLELANLSYLINLKILRCIFLYRKLFILIFLNIQIDELHFKLISLVDIYVLMIY